MEATEYKPEPVILMNKIQQMGSRISECVFAAEEEVIRHGEDSLAYYIIKSGSVVVLQKMLGEELEQVAVLGEGDGFGEYAILNGTKQVETVSALEETVLWVIPKTEFNANLKPAFLREVFPENAEGDMSGKYIFIDVRLEEEFDEEHIPGAVNIPLDRMRIAYSGLDPELEYYVYCLAGSRSATAAFMLGSRGFHARSIKGGLSAWDGPLAHANKSVNKAFVPT